MPRTYVKKKLGPNYTPEDLVRAVQDITNGNSTFKQAEETYGIPRSVIFNRIKGRKTPIDKLGAGRPTVLSPANEQDLVNCIKARARMGYPCDKGDVITIVAEFVKANNTVSPFKDGVPGDDWYYGFLHRHPSLSFKKPELLQKNRKDARKPDVIYDFYSELNQVANKCGINTKEKACFMFNCDEKGFNTDPTRVRAIGEKGSPLVRVTGGSGRESITVLAIISADGGHLPPFIVYKGASVQGRWVSTNCYPGTLYSASSNGWMEEPTFYEWFSSGFLPFVKRLREGRNCPDQKALLIFDGHGSHISYRIIKSAIENRIELIKLPSHLTDKIQPLDICVFGPLQSCWDRKLVSHGKMQIEKRGNCRLSKSEFATLIGQVWKESMTSKNAISGFISSGLFPVDARKFPESLFNHKELQDYKRSRALVPITHTNCSVQTPTSLAQTIENVQETTVAGISSIQVSSSSANYKSIELSGPPNLVEQRETEMLQSKELDASDKQTKNTITPKKNDGKSPKLAPVTPNSIIQIFTSAMTKNKQCQTSLEPAVTRKERKIPRLKPERYGEVLTSEQVLEKLKEAEEKKETVAKEKETKKLEKSKKNWKIKQNQI